MTPPAAHDARVPTPSVLAFVHRARSPRFLLLHRTPARGGFWQPVTGRLESGETWEAATLREVREETGLDALSLLDLEREVTFLGFDGTTYTERAYAVEVPDDAHHRASDEHDDARWVDLDDALALLHWPSNREALRDLARRLEDLVPRGKRL